MSKQHGTCTSRENNTKIIIKIVENKLLIENSRISRSARICKFYNCTDSVEFRKLACLRCICNNGRYPTHTIVDFYPIIKDFDIVQLVIIKFRHYLVK